MAENEKEDFLTIINFKPEHVIIIIINLLIY